MGNSQAGNSIAALLDRTAMLMSKDDDERTAALEELIQALDRSNKTSGQAVLDSKVVMDVLLDLSATTRSVDVAGGAFGVLRRLAHDPDNGRRLFQEHPSLVPVAMRKLELGAENATEEVQTKALNVLQNLTVNDDNVREMVTKNPTLVSLLVVKVESNLEQVQVAALDVLCNLAVNPDSKRDMVSKNPILVSLIVAKMESSSEHVQVGALEVLSNLATNDDNKREMVTKNPALVPLLVAKVEADSKQVQVRALQVLTNLAVSIDNKRAMVTKNPTLVSLLVAKVESTSEQVQVVALSVLRGLAVNVDNKREMVTKNPTLVPLLVTKVESNSEHVQVGALIMLQGLAANDDNAREMVIKNPTLVPLLVDKVKSSSEQVQTSALDVLHNLAVNAVNARDITKNPTLVPLLMAKVESNSEQVKVGALGVLSTLTSDVDNARDMVTENPMLVFLLVTKMSGSAALPATKVVYGLSCSPDNRAILRGSDSVVAALTKGRENKDLNTSFFSLLALVNLFGAEEDSEVLKTDLAMLQLIFEVIARAMNKDGWDLKKPLLAFRYLCVVEHNRQLLWNKYESAFLASVLAALQRAIDEKDISAMENAMSTLAQFSSDPKPLVWMRSNKPRLDKVIDQLAPFPDAQRTAQYLFLTLDPPKVIAAPVQVAGSKPTIMVSYNWTHQTQARLIHAILASQGYPVWRDEVRMQGNIMVAMADAVSKSTVILVLVSPFYKESINCQLECQFAHNNNRKLIPVLVEPGYAFGADGWLGLLLGSKIYYDVSGFHNEAQMKPVVLNLLRMEVEGGQGATPSVAAAPKQPVPQNEAEIRQWLSTHEEIAEKLVNEGLVKAKSLEMLSKKSWGELKAVLELNASQALTLEAALKELF